MRKQHEGLRFTADIGHFGKNSVRASFAFVAYPALMLTYLGQAAWMCSHIDLIPVTFFASIPFGNGFYWVTSPPPLHTHSF